MQVMYPAATLVKVLEAHKAVLKGSKFAFKLALTLGTPRPLELTVDELMVELERVKMAVQAFPGEQVVMRLGIDLVTPEAQDVALALQDELSKLQAQLDAEQKKKEEEIKAAASETK